MSAESVRCSAEYSPVVICSLPSTAVYTAVSSRPAGLSEDEARARLLTYGENRLARVKGISLTRKFLANFVHVMAILLWAGGIMAFVAGMPQLGIAIWLVVIINGLFSFWQEFKAERAAEALRNMLPTYARVLRSGQECRIAAEELVPGDVMLLAEGDAISADGRLVQEAEAAGRPVDAQRRIPPGTQVGGTGGCRRAGPGGAAQPGLRRHHRRRRDWPCRRLRHGHAHPVRRDRPPDTGDGQRPQPPAEGNQGGDQDRVGLRRGCRCALFRPVTLHGAHEPGRSLHLCDWDDRRLRAGRSTPHGDAFPCHGRPAHGRPPHAGQAPLLGGDPGLHHRHLYRQDGHAHPKRDDRA